MPINHGIENVINLSQVDLVVEGSNLPMNTFDPQPAGEVEKQIARNIFPYIRSGSTLQLGIGGIPSTMALCWPIRTLMISASIRRCLWIPT